MRAPNRLAGPSPIMTRLSRLAKLNDAERAALSAAATDRRHWPARREIVPEGAPIRESCAILSGWACRQRILHDGRRQILNFLIPGDLIGVSHHGNPVASATTLAVTDVTTCVLPSAPAGSGLAEAYAFCAALEDHHNLAQITRLGRLSAAERIADWLLETQERLLLAGLAVGDELPFPLTQEFLADTLGLTSVHVNRTLQAMRHNGLLASRSGTMTLTDPQRLREMVGYRAPHLPGALQDFEQGSM